MVHKVDTSGLQGAIPDNCQYFKEDTFYEILNIPGDRPDILKVVDLMIFPQVDNFYILETINAVSNEGQKISGLKLIVQLSIKEKLTYMSTNSKTSIHAVDYNFLKSLFVVIPLMIDGRDTRELINLDKISIVPYIETVYKRKIDNRSLFHGILMLVNVKFF